MATLASRIAEIDESCKNLIAIYHDWCRSDKSHIHQGLESAINHLIDVAGNGSVPSERRDLFPLVDRIEAGQKEWQQRMVDTGLVTILPDAMLWDAIHAIEDYYLGLEKPVYPPLESVADLRKIGCTDKQICEIYGWRTKEGAYCETWVEEEAKTPGCHSTNDPTWVHPVARIQAKKKTQLREQVAQLRQQAASKVQRANAVAPEPLAELVEQGVSYEQICRMKKITGAELEAQCEAEGLPVPARSVPNNILVGNYDPDKSPERQRILDAMSKPRFVPAELPDAKPDVLTDDTLSVEQRVILAHRDGQTADQIAESLRAAGERVRLGRVEKIIERYEAQPEAFSVED